MFYSNFILLSSFISRKFFYNNVLLKRNDLLWAQLTNMEQNYKDTVDIVRQQTVRINELEGMCTEYAERVSELVEEIRCGEVRVGQLEANNKKLIGELREAVDRAGRLDAELKETHERCEGNSFLKLIISNNFNYSEFKHTVKIHLSTHPFECAIKN